MQSLIYLAALAAVAVAAPGDGDWASAYSKATSALARLSQSDKISMVTGQGWMKGPCVGNTAAVASIGYPQLCLQDSPLGVRYAQQVTAFPAGVQVASTWDTSLMYARGYALGSEAKALGVHVQLGPVAGPLGKIPTGGRNWEGFSPDPYLTGIAMANTINGMQAAGVQACAKHFIGNEQENNRASMSSNIDDRTNHELYLWPFADAVKANVTSVMCSYNRLNGTYACENQQVLQGLLKDELDFQGYVISDWTAQHTTSGSANAGMDMSMPGDNFGDNNFLWGGNLANAISSGQVPQSRLDDMVKRILAGWFFVGQDSGYPQVTGWTSWNGGGGGPNVQGDHKNVARAIARDGIVLLKNTNNALPLKKPSSLAIIGQDAIVNPQGANSCSDRACDTGTLAMGWGSGTAEFPYLIAPLDAIKARAASDGTTITTSTTDDTASGATAAQAASTAIVFINSDSGENYLTVEGAAGDRLNLDPWHNGNGLVATVAATGKPTIVVIHSVGPLILEPIVSLSNVVAVVWAGIPGQESGNGLVDVLYGTVSPNGKLPYTIAKAAGDYGTGIASGDDNYGEGLFVDYRHFDMAGITPRYEFGFGLSYTTFAYTSLLTTPLSSSIIAGPTPATPLAPGGPSSLYTPLYTVSLTITNTGSVAGSEIAQLYITLPSSAPSSPPRQLRGFSKLSLAPGVPGTVSFQLRRKDLSYWDVGAQRWVLPAGTFALSVGASSRDIRLTGSLVVSSTGVSSTGVSSTGVSTGVSTGISSTGVSSTGVSSTGGGGCRCSATATATQPATSGWSFLGCYTDNMYARTLMNAGQVPGGKSAMTIELCEAACKSGGYALAGVEYSGECWCDNAFNNNGSPAPDGNAQCTMTCSGAPTETCGGPNRLDVYSYGSATATASPVATSWNLRGCYTDNIYARTLPNVITSPPMTVEKCTAACAAAGYVLAGVEYANECYCGNTLLNGGALAPDGNAQCNMPCGGNGAETCGGSNRLDIYSYGMPNL